MPRSKPSPHSITIAFAGDGPIKGSAVTELLNDALGFGPEDEQGYPEPPATDITLIFPISRKWVHDGLNEVLGWSGYVDLPFVAVTDGDLNAALEKDLKEAVETVKVENVGNGLLDLLEEAHDAGSETRLIMLWGAEDHTTDERYETLLDDAHNSEKIDKILDLTAGLDDLVFNDSADEPGVEALADPEPEPPTRRSRRAPAEDEPEPPRRRGRAKVEEPLSEPEKPLEDAPEPEVAPRRRTRTAAESKATADEALNGAREANATKAAIQNGEESAQDAALRYARNIATYFETAEANRRAANPGIHVEPAILSGQATALYAILSGDTSEVVANAEPVKRGRGRPRADGTPAQPATEAYIVEDGRYQKAGPGRKPRDQVRENLTAAQVKDLTEQGLVDEE